MDQRSGRTRADNKVRELLLKQPKGACHSGVVKVAKRLFTDIGSPVSKGLLAALTRGDVDYIAQASVDPSDYDRPFQYFLDACAVNFLRKADFLGELGETKLDPERAAIESFYKTEKQCADTNQRLIDYVACTVCPPDSRISEVLADARAIIKSVLGKVPSISDVEIRFGPGSTSQCSGDSVTVADKLVAFPEVTLGSRHWIDVVKNSPIWFHLMATVQPGCLYKPLWIVDDFGDLLLSKRTVIAPRLTRGNRFTMVNKTAKTKRGICVEPHTLSCIQLAIGSLLSDSLKKLGIQKDVAKEVHGRLAALASDPRSTTYGKLCTVDLEAASDTIAWALVRLLFPTDWFQLLFSLCSDETYIDGRWVPLEKLASMGNGFIFELESLIFYALTRASSNLVGGPNQTLVAVFGDDIICSKDSYELLAKVLRFAGFTVNQTKTFVGGNFNESCGQDFFLGQNVRPYFLKESPQYVTDWYGVANGIRTMGQRYGVGNTMHRVFVRAWLSCLDNIPSSFRLFGPPNLGNSVIHHDDPARWKIRRKSGRRKLKFVKSDFSTEWVEVPKDDGLREVQGLRPIIATRPMERYCDNTTYAALLYASDRGGVINCHEGSWSLRGDPIRLEEHWFSVS